MVSPPQRQKLRLDQVWPVGYGCSAEKEQSHVPLREFLGMVYSFLPNRQSALPGPWAWIGAWWILLGSRAILLPFSPHLYFVLPLCPVGACSPIPLSWTPSLPARASCLQPPSCHPSLPSCPLSPCLSSSKCQCSLPFYLMVCAGPTLPTPPDSEVPLYGTGEQLEASRI